MLAITLIAQILIPFILALAGLIILVFSGKPFPTTAKPIVNFPPVSVLTRCVLVVLILSLLAAGIYNSVSLEPLRIFDWSDEKAKPIRSGLVPVVHADSSQISFSLRGESAYLLPSPPFGGNVAVLVDEVSKRTEVMLVQNALKYPALQTAVQSNVQLDLDIGPGTIKSDGQKPTTISPGDILAKGRLGVKGQMSFQYQGNSYVCLVCGIEKYIFSKNRILVTISTGNTASCP
ncbi:MAG: hypothetical protein JNM66_19015 [Bryobacterales bacterium]|nr:hypothetical protein [Bryobacterales bacterium]